jgi:hypothetical protein
MMTVNRPEHGSFSYPGGGTPLFERSDRTPSTPTVRDADFSTHPVLICFRTAEGDFEALTHQHHVVAI